MALVIRELVTKLGFEVDNAALNSFEGSITALKFSLGALVGAAGAAAVGLFAAAKGAASAGEEIRAQAELTGLGVEEYQRYAFAAKQAEVSNEEFATSLKFLSRNIGDAVRGQGEAGKTFQSLGVRLTDAGGKTRRVGDILADVTDKFSGIKDPALRASLSMDLFGRGGARMGRFLSGGSKQVAEAARVIEAFGFFTDETASAGDRAGDSFEGVLTLVRGLRNEIGMRLFPIMEGLSKRITDWAIANQKLIRQRIDKLVRTLTKVVEIAAKAFGFLFNIMRMGIKMLGGFENAAKLAGIALAALAGAGIITGLLSLIKVIRSIGLASLITGAQMFLPFALAAAAIAALLIIGEDLYVWMKGGKSVTGQFLGSFEDFRDGLKLLWGDIKAIFGGMGEFIAGVFSTLWGVISGDLLLIKAGIESVVNPVKSLYRTLSFLGGGAINSIAARSALPSTAAISFAGAGQTGAGGVTNNVVTNVTLAVPIGTPKAQADSLKEQFEIIVDEKMSRQFNHVMRNSPRRS